MRRLYLLTGILLTFTPPLLAQEPPPIASTNKLSPAEEKAKLHLPPGFEVQLVAAEPDIHKPLNMDFDDTRPALGHDTVEYPFPAKHGKPAATPSRSSTTSAPTARRARSPPSPTG